jgi:hypothetical protein
MAEEQFALGYIGFISSVRQKSPLSSELAGLRMRELDQAGKVSIVGPTPGQVRPGGSR